MEDFNAFPDVHAAVDIEFRKAKTTGKALRRWRTGKVCKDEISSEEFPALSGDNYNLKNAARGLDPSAAARGPIKAFSPEKSPKSDEDFRAAFVVQHADPAIASAAPAFEHMHVASAGAGAMNEFTRSVKTKKTRRAGQRVRARKARIATANPSVATCTRAPTVAPPAPANPAAAPGPRIPPQEYNLYGRPGEYQMFGLSVGSSPEQFHGADAFTSSIQMVLREIREFS